MTYKELFSDGKVQLFGDIFKDRYPDAYSDIFAGTMPDSFALLKYGNREIIDGMTSENVTSYCGAVLDMCIDTFKSQWDVFNKEYDFLKPVVSGSTTEKSVTVQELNTDGSVKADKAFNDDDFVNDSKEDVTKDKERTETETVNVTNTGLVGNITESMLKEYNARLLKVRETIVGDLVSYITLDIYN